MIFLAIIAGIFVLELNLKSYVNSHWLQGSKQEILDSKIILRNCHNPHTAFGLIKDGKGLGTWISGFVLSGMLWDFLRLLFQKGSALMKLGYSLILGGGLSNFYDRKTKGYVTDYFSLGVKREKIRNTVFNLSDFCIFGGALLWLMAQFLPAKKEEKK